MDNSTISAGASGVDPPPGLLTPGNISNENYWRLFTRGVQIALIVHALFIPLFYFLGATLLAFVNIGSVIVYAVCLLLLKKGMNNPVILLSWVEITGHAVLAVRTLGWDSGFHYYLLMFIPLIFASATRKLSTIMIMTASICLIYMAMDAIMYQATPLITIKPYILDLVRYANILACFLILGYITHAYIQSVVNAEHRLALMASTDSLTELYNRRYLLEIAGYEMKQYKRTARPFSFIMADIDDFKSVNDTYGHDTGDQVLQMVSEQLRSSLREKDSVARWGGEEFLVLLGDTSIQSAVEIAERFRKQVSAMPVTFGHQVFSVTMTFGVSEIQRNETLEACIARTDAALYQGKQSGKNQVVVSSMPNRQHLDETIKNTVV